jgi:pimeloyl-ACP methyl ester carboxylesterase
MTSIRKSAPSNVSAATAIGVFGDGFSYLTDAAQRSVLFLDTLRERGNQYREQVAKSVPHVLDYKADLVVDGRTLERPVNYLLVKVIPPPGVRIDEKRRPFVVVDPRAGHGPGIGGFKADSEIGVAFKAGHPCYFIGFLTEPMPGQTIEDVARAEAIFLEKVISLHPDADGKPCVIGNCQAGWAVMMLAAIRPELFGPIIVAGAPLSYWAGVRGRYPMRYSGGLLGGSWLTALISDLGGGKFDGAWLVQNFESQNPANTLWTKQYNLYSKIDTETSRYLGFEKWWGGHVHLNAEEIQFIVDELFIGNNLAAGRIHTADGTAVDLRNIRSPIVVFCSKGDNITPPQQALGWILDLYEDVGDIRSYGQTIVYTVHETVGHLGIFVSGSVAKKEHGEFSSNIDLIDTLPPGLYEATFEQANETASSSDGVTGNWIMHCEARTLEDLRKLGGNDAADERRFAAAARVSEINLSFYHTFMQPFVRSLASNAASDWMTTLHPLRMQYEAFSNANPMMASVASMADRVRKDRRPVSEENAFLAVQERTSEQIVAALDKWQEMTESWAEQIFISVYGSPALQAAVGIDSTESLPQRKAMKNPWHREFVDKRIAELRSQIRKGGTREAVIRAILHVVQQRASVDERGFEIVRRIRKEHSDLTLAEFKKVFREQFYIMLIDSEAALSAIPSLLPRDQKSRAAAFNLIKQVARAGEGPSAEEIKRINEMAELFGVEPLNTIAQENRERHKGVHAKAS